MTSVPVEVAPQASQEMIDIFRYIAETSPQNAGIVLDAFERQIDRLAETPTAGHRRADVGDDVLRFVPVKSFQIVYEFLGGRVRVLRVIHSTRDFTKIDWR